MKIDKLNTTPKSKQHKTRQNKTTLVKAFYDTQRGNKVGYCIGFVLLHCVQKKNTHSHFLSYLQELFVDLNNNCSEYSQGLTDSDNVKIRYSLRSMT